MPSFVTLFGFILTLLPQMSMAAGKAPHIECPDCTDASGDQILKNLSVTLYDQFAVIAGAAAVAGLVFAGFMFVFANGDEGKVTNGKNAAFASILGVGLAYIAGSIVETVRGYTPSSGFDPAEMIGKLANLLLTIFNTSMVIVIILGGIRMVVSAGNQGEVQKGTNAIKYALIGGAIANAAKVIVQLVLKL